MMRKMTKDRKAEGDFPPDRGQAASKDNCCDSSFRFELGKSNDDEIRSIVASSPWLTGDLLSLSLSGDTPFT